MGKFDIDKNDGGFVMLFKEKANELCYGDESNLSGIINVDIYDNVIALLRTLDNLNIETEDELIKTVEELHHYIKSGEL